MATKSAAKKTAVKPAFTGDDPDKANPTESGRIAHRREFLAVTPGVAQGFLDQLHPDQRRYRDARVDGYAQDMRSGNWREDTEDTILIDWNGYLIDGQNRLRAVIESGATIRIWVVWGVDPAVMRVKDTGAPRTVADSLRIDGFGEGMTPVELGVLGAIARREIHWEAGRRTTGSMKSLAQATHSDIGHLLKRQPDIYNAAKIGIDASRSNRPSLHGPTIYGFFWLHANRVHSDFAYRWQSFWITPEELPGNSPITVVRERFFRSKMAQSRGGAASNRGDILKPDEQLALMIRAWNWFLADRKATATKFLISRGKLDNDNFPRFLTPEQAKKEAEKYEREMVARAANKAAQ